jgi:hypothetical protein
VGASRCRPRPDRRLPGDVGCLGNRRLDRRAAEWPTQGLTGILWLAFFVAILVEQALLDKATRGLFKLRGGELDERQHAVRDLGYRYGFRILAVAATTILAVALYLPVDRFLGAINGCSG